MENKAHALAAGAFVLVVAALLVALAVWLTRDSGVRLVYEVSTNEAVTGLQPQASVRFRGVNVGKVSAIGFDRQVPGNVLVRLAVHDDTPITRSTFASLGFQGVTGIAFVQLDDNGESKERLVSSEAQPGRIPMRPGLVSQLSQQSTRILKELEETSRRVNQLLAPENQKALMAGIGTLSQAAASLPPALEALQAGSRSVAGGADEVKKTAGELGRLTQQVQQPGGVLEQLAQGAQALTASGKIAQTETLPRLNHGLDEVARAARGAGRAASQVSDDPRILIFGPQPLPPGPGEPGFVAPGGAP